MGTLMYGTIIPNSPAVLLARVEDTGGNLITLATVDSISAVVTDLSTDIAADPVTLDVSESVFDTLQLTELWDADQEGYNLACELDGDNFPTGDTTYQVAITITPANDSQAVAPFKLVWRLQAEAVF